MVHSKATQLIREAESGLCRLQNVEKNVAAETQEAAQVEAEVDNWANPNAIKVCIMTADFWGLKSAGGTATAYHLLAAVLAKSRDLHVSLWPPSLHIINSRVFKAHHLQIYKDYL